MTEIDGDAYLISCPVVGETGRCDRGGVWEVTGVQDEYVPGTDFSGNMVHCLVVDDIGAEIQTANAVVDRM